MTKADLIESLAIAREMSKREAGEILDHILVEILQSLQNGEKVQLIPFFSLDIRERKKREGRNPQTGERIMIAARRVPAFTAGKALRDAVAGSKKRRAVPRRVVKR